MPDPVCLFRITRAGVVRSSVLLSTPDNVFVHGSITTSNQQLLCCCFLSPFLDFYSSLLSCCFTRLLVDSVSVKMNEHDEKGDATHGRCKAVPRILNCLCIFGAFRVMARCGNEERDSINELFGYFSLDAPRKTQNSMKIEKKIKNTTFFRTFIK